MLGTLRTILDCENGSHFLGTVGQKPGVGLDFSNFTELSGEPGSFILCGHQFVSCMEGMEMVGQFRALIKG
jgi:hypothetical protein